MRVFRLTKISAFVLALLLTAVCLITAAAPAKAYTFTPDCTLHSEAAIIYSRTNDQILYEKNADQQQMPGHLVQLMTAVIVMEQCSDLDGTTITVDDALYSPLYRYEDVDDLRYANLYNGDTLTVREYLYALMLTSSCEAAVVLSDYFGNGSEAAFVNLMNEKAKAIGCNNTNFTNASGLYDPAQTTTARDMLTLTNYALSLEGFEDIATTVTFTPTSPNPENHEDPAAWIWTQANPMMLEDSDYYYEGAAGIKTGNLSKTGRSIVTEATRDGETYLVVLLNAPFNDENGKLQFYHLEDAAALLNWAFSSFSYVTMLEDDEEIGEVEVLNADGNSYVLVRPENSCVLLWNTDVDTSAVQKVISLDENAMAPVEPGQQLGEMQLKFSGEVIATVPLVAVSGVDRSFSKYNLYALQNFPHSPWFVVGIAGGFILTALYIALCIYAAYRAKRNVTPEDPVHLVPRATVYHDRPQQNWKRSETVFYHGPEHRQHSEEAQEQRETEESKSHETVGSGRR